MAWYPAAWKRVINPGPNDPPIKVIGAILHVDAGDSKSLFGYFGSGKSDGIESHFHVPKAGLIEQYRDTGYEADANYKANSFMRDGERVGFVSIETQGLDRGQWNEHQLAGIKDLLKWLSTTHGFPLRVTPGPFEPGVGYHTLFGAPGPWTPHSKTCPGPDRVRQFRTVLAPWFQENQPPNGGTGSAPGKVDDDMANADDVLAELRKLTKILADRYEVDADRYEDQKKDLQTIIKAVAPKPAAPAKGTSK